MNDWVAEEFPFPDHIPLERGKVLREPDLEAMADFARYLESDGDGVCPRTLPGNRHPAAPYFTRGSGHNPKAEYSERPGDYARLMERLARKIRGAVPSLPPPFIADGAGGPVGIVAWGSTHAAVEEARDRLREEHGVETGYLRLRSLPPGEDTARFLERHERVYVVEQNRDGQMRAILQIEFPAAAARLRSVLHCDGVPVDAGSIAESILEGERKGEDHVA
jgi:2-oxoglutarate ferredoxin oxidoreductase subunit alpha